MSLVFDFRSAPPPAFKVFADPLDGLTGRSAGPMDTDAG
jgi:hypothetical protein